MFTMNVISVFTFVLTIANSADISSDSDSNGCILPKYPINGRWFISSGPNHAPGEKIENGAVLSVTCNSQYKLNGSSVLTCHSGKWSAKIGKCLELCPPIVEKYSTKVTCSSNREISDCNTPTNGTIATIKCAPYYDNLELNRNPFRVCKNGRWNEKILSCSAVCGLEPTLTVNDTSKQLYPWNVLIYEKEYAEYGPSCAGTLINEKTILTVASCVADFTPAEFLEETVHLLERLIVAAGKTIEKYENPDRDPGVQYSYVQDVFVPDTYQGNPGKYFSDIAIIIARTPFKMTRRVHPACLDWSNKYKKEFCQQNMSTKVAGLALKNSNDSTGISEIDVTVLTDRKCIELLRFISHSVTNLMDYNNYYIANDKYCAENITSSLLATECKNRIYRGVGLIKKNSFDGKHYVVGVTSVGSSHYDCYNKSFSLFTRVFDYVRFISEKTSLYSTIERVEFQTSCGIKSVQAQTLIVSGNTVARGDYPWQVAVYRINGAKKNLICGGSLINQRVILTAAHCVTNQDGEIFPKEKYIVAVGKYYRNFNDSRDNHNSQFSALKEIIVPSKYKGILQNYLGDIAILISETSFDVSRGIQPICVDWEAKYESQFIKPNRSGFVAGWGLTQENQDPSQELKDLEVPYIDIEQCKNEIPSDFEIFLTNDKLCSGFLQKGKSVCSGDSGGGLVFKNKNDDRYYLAGVVSVAPQAPTGGCNSQQYALYTRVSKYIKNFVLETARLYWS